MDRNAQDETGAGDPVPGDRREGPAIPFQAIVEKAEAGVYQAKPARVFGFEEIGTAHRVMEAGQAGGKLVVTGA